MWAQEPTANDMFGRMYFREAWAIASSEMSTPVTCRATVASRFDPIAFPARDVEHVLPVGQFARDSVAVEMLQLDVAPDLGR